MSGGIRESALKWFEEKQFKGFPLLLDPGKVFYRHLGLQRSVKKVWNLRIMQLYAEERLAGVAPSPHYSGDDVHLMGGDFILNSSGVMLYAYHSKDSQDRPDVGTLLSFIRGHAVTV